MAGYPHCTDEETSTENLRNLLKVSHLVFHTAELGCKAHIRTPGWAVVPARSQISVLCESCTEAELAARRRGAIVGPSRDRNPSQALLRNERNLGAQHTDAQGCASLQAQLNLGPSPSARPRLLSCASGSPQCGQDSCWQLQTDILPA